MILKVGKKEYNFEKGENLLKCMQRNEIMLNNYCNGKATCGKCKLRILSGNIKKPSDFEKKILTAKELEEGVRLACKVNLFDNIEIENIENNKSEEKILSSGYMPEFKRDNFYKAYGLALDIGTTTMVLSMYNMENHEELFSISAINPQKKYGMDVLTRISYALENKDGNKNLQKTLLEGVNEMIEKVSQLEENRRHLEKDSIKKEIKEIVVSANCTMSHSLLGKDISSLGTYPYKTVFKDIQKIKAKELGLDLGEDSILYTLPQISAFIGGDIAAGVYVCNFDRSKKKSLFLDIGTNGEIVLTDGKKILSCSCAAGPALEGMNIKYGMRAEKGAIEEIEIKADATLNIRVIGDEKIRGLCGSGILALVRELIKNKLIKPRGAFLKLEEIDQANALKKYLREVDGKREFVIDENIYFTQFDLRQVQLAKGAILSAIRVLLEKMNMQVEDIDEFIIAGQFGKFISQESLIITGLLPKEAKGKISYVGNSSKTGAYMFLTSFEARSKIKDLASKIDYCELASVENYDRKFAKSMIFYKE